MPSQARSSSLSEAVKSHCANSSESEYFGLCRASTTRRPLSIDKATLALAVSPSPSSTDLGIASMTEPPTLRSVEVSMTPPVISRYNFAGEIARSRRRNQWPPFVTGRRPYNMDFLANK